MNDSDRTPHDTFKGRGALVYGGAQGIGRGIAVEFARRGARVGIADINLDGALATVAAIEAIGGAAFAVACDVTREPSVHEAARQSEAALGDIDIVANNVGSLALGNPEDIPTSEWRRIMDLNYFSMVHSNQYFLPKMMSKGRGHIVNTASFAGLYPYASSRIPYAASKAAVIAMSESLAIRLHPLGVRVSCFCPGPVATNMTAGVKFWTQGLVLNGPGSQYKVRTPEDAAVVLADGMQAGRIIIPTDDAVWDVIRRHAESPDAFIDSKIAEFEAGDLGMPSIKVADS